VPEKVEINSLSTGVSMPMMSRPADSVSAPPPVAQVGALTRPLTDSPLV
jgi:hypothetical protein